MSEEEIIKFLEEYKKTGYNTLYIKNNGDRHKINSQIENAIQGLLDLYKNSISKDKLKEIIYPTPTNPIPLEVQQSNMYRKIIELLEE